MPVHNGNQPARKLLYRHIHAKNIGILFLAVRSHDAFDIPVIHRVIQIRICRMITAQRSVNRYRYSIADDSTSLSAPI